MNPAQEEFVESEMRFGPFAGERLFRIEQCEVYLGLSGGGVKIADFLRIRYKDNGTAQMQIVEAKSSSPQPENTSPFGTYCDDILQKWINAFALTVSMRLGRHTIRGLEQLPRTFQDVDLTGLDVLFVLVIRGHREEWLSPLKDRLESALKAFCLTWAIGTPFVAVLNEEGARRHGLIAADH